MINHIVVDKEFVVVEKVLPIKGKDSTNKKYSLSMLLVAGHLLGY